MRRTSVMLVVVAIALGTSACKRNQEPVEEPKDDTWVPDESLEAAAAPAQPAQPELSEEEKLAKAKELYVQAEGKAGEEDWAAALGLYEQAYYLVPSKHGFALKVGIAAEQVGDCEKAITYYEHFVKYAEPDKYGDDLAKTKKSLDALKKKGC